MPHRNMLRAPHSTSRQGFTLVEMMVVVVMVGVLATLAVFGVRKYILSAKTGEAVSMMTTIKTAEESFKDETFVYLNVSSDFGTTTNWYPTAVPGRFKTAWGDPKKPDPNVAQKWLTLGAAPNGPVMFTYAVVAGGPSDAYPALPTAKSATGFNLPTAKSQWFIAAAKADLDGDGNRFTYVLSHSFSSEVYIENDGE